MDYGELSTILSFPTCGTRQCVNVSIVDDDVLENVESFHVTLERTPGPNGWRITLDPMDGVIEIRDDDGLFSNSSGRELYGWLLEEQKITLQFWKQLSDHLHSHY